MSIIRHQYVDKLFSATLMNFQFACHSENVSIFEKLGSSFTPTQIQGRLNIGQSIAGAPDNVKFELMM